MTPLSRICSYLLLSSTLVEQSVICFANITERPSIVFRNLGVDRGVSHSGIFQVHQDPQGTIWIGTAEGLNEYDGVAIRIYNKRNSKMLSDAIRSITSTPNGTLWIATDAGLYKRSSDSSEFQYFELKQFRQTTRLVRDLLVDPSGNLWVAHEKGLSVISYKDNTDSVLLSGKHVRALGKDSKNRIWAGTNDGIIYRFNSIEDTQPQEKVLQEPVPIRSLHPVYKNEMWIGTITSGISILNSESMAVKTKHTAGDETLLTSNEIRSIIRTKNGTICVGTARGLAIFNPEENIYQTYTSNPSDYRSLAHNIVLDLYEDATGLIWVSTYLGVSVWQDTTKYLTSINRSNEIGLPDNNVTSFAFPTSSDDIWIGTLNGLAKWDSKQGSVIDHSNLLDDGRISSLEVDHQNNLWIGTFESGITVVRADGSIVTYKSSDGSGLPSNAITSIKTDSTGRVWVATFNSGIIYFDDEKFQPLESFITGNFTSPTNPTTLKSDSSHLWVGTIGQGFFGINLASRSIDHLVANKPDSVIAIWPSSNGKLWLGTWNDGVYLYDSNSQKMEAHFTMADGLSSNGIYGIVEAQGNNIWISSGHGLDLFNFENRTAQHYGRDKGAQHDDFNSNAFAKTNSNIILFGGANGFNAFFSTENKLNSEGPPISISTIHGEGDLLFELRSEPSYTPLTLDHDTNDIDFKMAILDYTNPDHNLYQYRLIGYDRSWQISTHNHAFYTNLDPGEYTFEFKGSAGDRIWTKNTSHTRFTIKNPPWLTYPAYFLYLILFAIAAWIARIYFQNQIKLTNMEHLEMLVKERTSDLSKILSEKELLLKEIHHRVKNNMQLITSLLTIQAKTIDDESIKEMFRMCQGRIQTMALIHESLYKSDNLKSINIHEYMTALTANISHFPQSPGFQQPTIELSVDQIVMDIDIAIVCGLIVNELVTNSMKHAFSRAQSNPTISVSLTATEDTYRLQVSDNGTGIKNLTVLESPTTMGFSIISVLATHQLEGQIVLDSESGTSIEIIFPRDS